MRGGRGSRICADEPCMCPATSKKKVEKLVATLCVVSFCVGGCFRFFTACFIKRHPRMLYPSL